MEVAEPGPHGAVMMMVMVMVMVMDFPLLGSGKLALGAVSADGLEAVANHFPSCYGKLKNNHGG